MPYVRLGNSGLKVSKIILGTKNYGDTRWTGLVINEKEAIKHIKAAYEAGIQTFDTANAFSNGESERILGKAIKILGLPREEIVVMTKVYFVVGRTPLTCFSEMKSAPNPEGYGYVNQRGLSRKHIFDSVKRSLERLQLDYIDVLYCHRFDYDTPIEETMQALHDVVQAGYVRYIGMVSCYAYQFHTMQNYAINNKLTPFIVMQNHYNLAYREEEREMIPTLEYLGVGCVSWSPLARGLWTHPLTEETKKTDTDPYLIAAYKAPGTTEIVNRVREIAKARSITMDQVALAWCLSKPAISASAVGAKSLKELGDLIAALHIHLTDGEVQYLEEPYQPQQVTGHH